MQVLNPNLKPRLMACSSEAYLQSRIETNLTVGSKFLCHVSVSCRPDICPDVVGCV